VGSAQGGGRETVSLSPEGMALLRMHLVDGLGPRRLAAIVSAFGSARAAWREGPDAWRDAAGVPLSVVQAAHETGPERVRRELDRLEALGGWVITLDDESYPELLRNTSRPPAALFGLGRLPREPAIAIVGTRRPTPSGRRTAAELAGELARGGVVITSGMAFGIDAEAHRACLEAGGLTVAVLGHGLDRCYPPAHRPLMERIAARGAVITEFPLGTEPRAGLFPARNRLIAGMSVATVVVEASLRSGAMITATAAAEEGREVFAVPGDVHRWASKGPHQLLREGAVLTESAADIWAALPALRPGGPDGAEKPSVYNP